MSQIADYKKRLEVQINEIFQKIDEINLKKAENSGLKLKITNLTSDLESQEQRIAKLHSDLVEKEETNKTIKFRLDEALFEEARKNESMERLQKMLDSKGQEFLKLTDLLVENAKKINDLESNLNIKDDNEKYFITQTKKNMDKIVELEEVIKQKSESEQILLKKMKENSEQFDHLEKILNSKKEDASETQEFLSTIKELNEKLNELETQSIQKTNDFNSKNEENHAKILDYQYILSDKKKIEQDLRSKIEQDSIKITELEKFNNTIKTELENLKFQKSETEKSLLIKEDEIKVLIEENKKNAADLHFLLSSKEESEYVLSATIREKADRIIELEQSISIKDENLYKTNFELKTLLKEKEEKIEELQKKINDIEIDLNKKLDLIKCLEEDKIGLIRKLEETKEKYQLERIDLCAGMEKLSKEEKEAHEKIEKILRFEIESIKNENDKKIHEFNLIISAKDNELNSLNIKIDEFLKKNSDLSHSLTLNESLVQKSEKDIFNLKADLESLKNESQKKIEDLCIALEVKENEIKILNLKLEENFVVISNKEESISKHEESNKELDALKADLEAIKTVLTVKEKDLYDFNQKIEDNNKKIDDLSNKLALKEENIFKLKESKKILERIVSDKNEEIHNLTKEKIENMFSIDFNEKSTEFKEMEVKLNKEIEAKQSELNNLQEKNNFLLEERSEMEEEITHLKEQLAETKTKQSIENINLKKTNQILLNKVEERKRNSICETENLIEKLKLENEIAVKEKEDENIKKIVEVTTSYSTATCEIENLRKHVYSLENELSSIKIEKTQNENEKVLLRTKNEDLIKTIASLNTNLSEKEQVVSSYEEKINVLADNLRKKENNYEDLIKDFKTLLDETATRDHELQYLRVQLENRKEEEYEIIQNNEKKETIKRAGRKPNTSGSKIEQQTPEKLINEDTRKENISDDDESNEELPATMEKEDRIVIPSPKKRNLSLIQELEDDDEDPEIEHKELLEKIRKIKSSKLEQDIQNLLNELIMTRRCRKKTFDENKELSSNLEKNELEKTNLQNAYNELNQREQKYLLYIDQLHGESDKMQSEIDIKKTLETEIEGLKIKIDKLESNEKKAKEFFAKENKIKTDLNKEIEDLKKKTALLPTIEKNLKEVKEEKEKLKEENEKLVWNENNKLKEKESEIEELKKNIEKLEHLNEEQIKKIKKLNVVQKKNENTQEDKSEASSLTLGNEGRKGFYLASQKAMKMLNDPEKEQKLINELEEINLMLELLEI